MLLIHHFKANTVREDLLKMIPKLTPKKDGK